MDPNFRRHFKFIFSHQTGRVHEQQKNGRFTDTFLPMNVPYRQVLPQDIDGLGTMPIDAPMTQLGLYVPQAWGVGPALSFLAISDRAQNCVLAIYSSGASTRSPIVRT